jgi:hypothetical protein
MESIILLSASVHSVNITVFLDLINCSLLQNEYITFREGAG